MRPTLCTVAILLALACLCPPSASAADRITPIPASVELAQGGGHPGWHGGLRGGWIGYGYDRGGWAHYPRYYWTSETYPWYGYAPPPLPGGYYHPGYSYTTYSTY